MDTSRRQLGALLLRDYRTNTAIAFSAIVAFVIVGGTLSPYFAKMEVAQASPTLVAAFILNTALILFAWRRSTDLRNAISKQRDAEQRAHELAYKDEATGLYNRRYFTEQLDTFSRAEGSNFALVLIDIDHFKKVNDLYGHAAGDQLLLRIAAQIECASPPNACCARLGGDEFAILLKGIDALDETVTVLAERLLADLSRPIRIDATLASVGASIGLSSLAQEGGEPRSLLRQSDIAMYEAKRLGRNCVVWFNEAMELELNRRNSIEAEIRIGLSQGLFVPFFQPLIDIETGDLKGFEVLARWEHPTKGILEPKDFIPLAETTGLISELSLAVMRTALCIARHWPSDFTLAVNISPIQFKDPILDQRILKLLTEVGFPAHRLELEITESAIMEDSDLALTTITSLKNQGIRISLDDFGTGYASLTQLRSLPFDRIKIDRSFVASLLGDEQSNAIVHAIATLGKSLRLPITAEGIETGDIYDRVKDLGCTDAQGWLFGRAMSIADVQEYLEESAAPDSTKGSLHQQGKRAAL